MFEQQSSFPRRMAMIRALLLLALAALAGYAYSVRQLADIQQSLVETHTQVAELRQLATDLGSLARRYVQTGDPQFRQLYEAVIAVRDGLQPADIAHNTHQAWAAMLQARYQLQSPRPLHAHPLLQLLSDVSLTRAELEQLGLVRVHSRQREEFEQQAFSHLEFGMVYAQQALRVLDDTAYEQTQLQAAQALDTFLALLEQRTQGNLFRASLLSLLLLGVSLALFTLLFYVIWLTYRQWQQALGADIETLDQSVTRIAHGDLTEPIVVTPHMKYSLMGWLGLLQKQLVKMKEAEAVAKAHNQRLTQLYLALSQCNQAIVRCQSRQELFEQICRIIVVFGHAKMAWVGELDATGTRLMITASYGKGSAYLDELQITVDAGNPAEQGPCGLAILEDAPCWIQDFLHDARTSMWHVQAAQFGWAASASLPLHRGGAVIGSLSLYADEIGAFDVEAQKLLQEMAADIDFALGRFDMEQERTQYRQSLHASEESARLVLENALDAVINIDVHGVITEWSGSAQRIFGYARTEVLGLSLGEVIVPPVHREAHAKGMRRLLDSGQPQLLGKLIEINAIRRDGTEFPVELTIAHIDREGQSYFSAFLRDISARKASEDRISYLANYDALTGLPNRNQLHERVASEIARAQRQHNQFALMFLDLDHFKDVNDSLGHSYGDHLLIQLARRFQALLRAEDTVCRLGGDEFVFLIPNADHEVATQVVEKVLRAIEEPIRIEQYQLAVTGSIGITLYPGDGLDLETLQRNADVAMYRTKKESRNGYRFFSSTMQIQSARNLQLVNALRQAIPLGQLAVFYQPQIDVSTQQVVGVEALLRWQHPQFGAVSPAEFIPLAESSGLIMSIGGWVLEQAIQQAKAWHAAGLPRLRMAVNLSSVQFRDPELPRLVGRILAEQQFPAEYLELELTEGVALEDPVGAIAMMDALDHLGVRLSIDDFGTGYSSLSYLKKFKVYKLKIDQSFVRDISTDEEDKAIVIAIIQLARSLGLKTIAEGVETAAQLAFLQAQGCNEMQGYLLSKPLPGGDATAFLQQRLSPAT